MCLLLACCAVSQAERKLLYQGPRATPEQQAEGAAATAAAAAQQVEQDGLVTCTTQECACEPCVISRQSEGAGPCQCTAKRETGYMCNCCWQHCLEIIAEAEQMKADAEQAKSKVSTSSTRQRHKQLQLQASCAPCNSIACAWSCQFWVKVTELTPAHYERNRLLAQQQANMQQHQALAMQAAAALPPAAAPAAEGSPAAEAAPASSGTQTPAQQTRTSGFRYPPFPQT